MTIIGAGRLGRALARLWQANAVFEIVDVLNRSPASAAEAVAFIGAGRPVADWAALGPARAYLLSVPDGCIAECARRLVAGGALPPGAIVFHASGALPATVLSAAGAAGAHIASVHPLKSFADPAAAVRSFAGTFCAAEGEPAALAVLRPAFEQIGARVVDIDPARKTLYHAAGVLASNDLVALLETALQCLGAAGIDRATGRAMLDPIVRGTLDNVTRLDTAGALTGPVARGDVAVVAAQLAALAAWQPAIADVYRDLGRVALTLARHSDGLHPDAAAELARRFDEGDENG